MADRDYLLNLFTDQKELIMRSFKLLLFVLIYVSTIPFVSVADEWNLERISKSVVYLHTSNPEKSQKVNKPISDIGTGFLLNAIGKRRGDGSEFEILFLVTANHVFATLNENTKVTFGMENDHIKTVNLVELESTTHPKWFTHDIADVSVLCVEETSGYYDLLKSRSITSDLLNGKMEAPSRDYPLTIVGFPLGLGFSTSPDSKISPISKESKPSSGLITLPRFDNNIRSNFFILDSPSVGGFSGSPVFIISGIYTKGYAMVSFNKTTCYGLVHGTISDNTGGKFAVVVPSKYIFDILNKAVKEILIN